MRHDHFHCVLCQASGARLVAPGDVPCLFHMLEHLVVDHRVPWTEVLSATRRTSATVGSEAQVEEWCLPEELAAALGLSQPCCLRVTRGCRQANTHFYFCAAFPTRDLCRRAERDIIDACTASAAATSLCGGEAGMGEIPIVMYIAREPGLEPSPDVRRSLWASIHRHLGSCISLPGGVLENFLLFARREALIARALDPGARWAEISYHDGRAIEADSPGSSEATGGSLPT